jgi:hypothetical protein
VLYFYPYGKFPAKICRIFVSKAVSSKQGRFGAIQEGALFYRLKMNKKLIV